MSCVSGMQSETVFDRDRETCWSGRTWEIAPPEASVHCKSVTFVANRDSVGQAVIEAVWSHTVDVTSTPHVRIGNTKTRFHTGSDVSMVIVVLCNCRGEGEWVEKGGTFK